MARLKSEISRRDFLNGVALSVAAGALSPSVLFAARAAAAATSPYPPALTGLRGAHPGAFETAHALAWEGRKWERPAALTDTLYDLVVIGAGLSGLAAAQRFRDGAAGPVKILVLDNHDDFGGHARRNEFMVDGKTLIGHGGSQSIDGPASFSNEAKNILSGLGVDVSKFYNYFDQAFYQRHAMRPGLYADRKTYGADVLTDIPFSYWSEEPEKSTVKKALSQLPLQDATKSALKDLVLNKKDFLKGKTTEEKIAVLRKTSYEDYLRQYAAAPEELVLLLRRIPLGIWGAGWDVLSALEAARWGMPGTAGLGLGEALRNPHESEEPYIFHFPDGNASLARLFVRNLAPAAASGSTMEDMVTSPIDYSTLDQHDADVRIRLGATAIDIQHSATGKSVDVVYVKNGETHRVRGRHSIFAGYMAMAPYMCPEMPEAQKDAIRFFTKIPLVYVNVALKNWRAFAKAGYHRFYAPSAFFESLSLDFPVSMGEYKFSSSPDEPIVLHMQYVPIEPGVGLNEKEQHKAGRRKLYAMSYDEFETAIVDQLTGMLAAHGFDAERDIAAITVNRWPHGYAYEYNELFDPPDWTQSNGPHFAARAAIGRISIANSDASALAYVNGAFDAAVRAVDEQLAIKD